MSLESKSLLDLPNELITHILAFLDEPSLLRSKLICRSISTLIEASILLKYNIELYASNLIDNPDSSLAKSVRLRLLHAHRRAWTQGFCATTTEIPLAIGGVGSPLPLRAWELTGSTFGLSGDHNIRFVQLPSGVRGIEQFEWGFEGFNFRIRDFATDRSQDLLVMIERETLILGSQDFIHIHLRSLSTGLRHPHAQEAIITHRICVLDADPDWYAVHIYGSRIAVMVQAVEASESHPSLGYWISELGVWDWNSGVSETVLTGPIRAFSFLTEHLMLLGMCWLHSVDPQEESDIITLDVVDINKMPLFLKVPETLSTSSTRWSRDWWSFQLPSLAKQANALRPCLSIRSEYSPASFAYCKDVPFTTSSADRLYVVTIANILPYQDLVLFVRLSSILSLVGHSPIAPHTFPWAEWGPLHTRMVPGVFSDTWFCYVHGLKVVVPAKDPSIVEVWDFNQHAIRRNSHTPQRSGGNFQTKYITYPVNCNHMVLGFRLFEHDVITSLPYSLSTFRNPDPSHESQDFMISGDSLIVVLDDDDKLIVASF
ncbi:hypothetical protein D9615_003646 [Tricholomella constricta]|uniref:F-box domain-containing protein n=1 Tax=Tricholomella constricta TaxID=117010 RepID=A0A8H5HI28_9AGAR|nr:hypothetical protein D9615_003646 [Tricholomella constricta]